MSRIPLGPGPGAYMLPSLVGYPNHDISRTRNPMFSIGNMRTTKYNSIGPGPASYALENLTRHGKRKSAAFPLAGKPRDIRKNLGPGPGAYNVTNSFKGKRSPAFTIGLRTDLLTREQKPGPNQYSYSLKLVKPGSPAFSIGAKPYITIKSHSPGPAAYQAVKASVIGRRAPAFPIFHRNESLFGRSGIPGPNAYNLMDYKPGDRNPAFTFGVKHSQYVPPMIVPCDTPVPCH